MSKVYQMGQVAVHALDNVNLRIKEGELIAILGPSGSGKTTLLNLVGGIDSPTDGSILIDGLDIAKLDESRLTDYRRTRIGFVFQFFNLVPTLTATENVELAAELVSQPVASSDILRRVGLGDRGDHFPAELSGGEQQRVAIARALVKNPPILLCDEPTGELDYKTGIKILSLIRKINRESGITVILVTHNSAIGEIADRIVRLRSGRVAEVRENSHPINPEELRW
ncbi:MAG: ABC transporter ATP-binding protein [Nitrososphaerales archaeon]